MASMIKPSHRGLLHKKLGVPQDENIPESKIEAARHSSSPALRKEAVFAQNFGHKAPGGQHESIVHSKDIHMGDHSMPSKKHGGL